MPDMLSSAAVITALWMLRATAQASSTCLPDATLVDSRAHYASDPASYSPGSNVEACKAMILLEKWQDRGAISGTFRSDAYMGWSGNRCWFYTSESLADAEACEDGESFTTFAAPCDPPHVSSADCASVWEPIPDVPVSLGEVSAGRVKVNGESGICVVGEGDDGTHCYSPCQNSWRAAETRPCAGNHHCTVVVDNTMYLLGGLDGEGSLQMCGTKLQSFDGSTWATLPDLPFSTGSASCGERNGVIWVCGGIVSTTENETGDRCASYDIASATWSEGAAAKAATNHAAYCKRGGKLVMVAGRQGGNVVGEALDTCQTFSMKTQATGSCATLPYPTAGVGKCINRDGNIWVFGGELNDEQFAEFGSEFGGTAGGDGGTLSAVSVLVDGDWQQKARMPVAKHGILPVTSGGYVYIIGGGTAAGASGSSTAHRAKLDDLITCDL